MSAIIQRQTLTYVSPPEPGIRVGRVAGVDIRLDWSLLIIFALITINLGAGLFPVWHPNWGTTITWATALSASALFLGSVLLHEASHAVAARAFGNSVTSITLFLFGGMARISGEPRSWRADFVIAGVGPLTSLIIGFVAMGLGAALIGGRPVSPEEFELQMRHASPWVTLLLWLGPTNIMLALFNVLPGFPLDGGRLLRSVLWATTGDFTKATRWAALGGQVFAGILIVIGLVNIISLRLGQGVWLILIGWFLGSAASASSLQTVIKSSLRHVPITQVMRTQMGSISPGLPVSSLVREHFLQTDQRAWPVIRDGQLDGLVTWSDLRRLPQNEWDTTPVQSIMTPRGNLLSLSDNETAETALELMTHHDIDQLPVLRGDVLLGWVRRGDLLRWLALHSDLKSSNGPSQTTHRAPPGPTGSEGLFTTRHDAR